MSEAKGKYKPTAPRKSSGTNVRKRRRRFAASVDDERWTRFFYLDEDVEELVGRLSELKFTPIPNSRDVPFTAQVRGYQGAIDSNGELWLLKEVEDEETFEYKQCEIAYYLDFMLETLSAPTLLIRRDGRFYRATKVIVDAVQIGSCNYLEEPLRRIVANDLINRWLMFDEDRNPNNYMVIQNAQGAPLVVAIDFNKADFTTAGMKITGNAKQFGWIRSEKTRFLTLLEPESFAIYALEDFEARLRLLRRLSGAKIRRVCTQALGPFFDDAPRRAGKIAKNLIERRDYIDEYFLRWFKPRNVDEVQRKHSEYEGLGKNFVEFYEKKI